MPPINGLNPSNKKKDLISRHIDIYQPTTESTTLIRPAASKAPRR